MSSFFRCNLKNFIPVKSKSFKLYLLIKESYIREFTDFSSCKLIKYIYSLEKKYEIKIEY